MAADSTFNETEGSPEQAQSEPASMLGPNPPRPPRPAKRPLGTARVPMPSPADRIEQSDFGAEVVGSSLAEPSLDDASESEPEFPLVASRAKPVSASPEESFADIDADLADRAPSAPITPWRGVPPLAEKLPEFKPSPAVATRLGPSQVSKPHDSSSSPAVAISHELDEHEDTIVGQAPKNLLELSSSGDENTRAYTAPQELIELAKRKREERLKAGAAIDAVPEAHSRETARPPNRAAALTARDAAEDMPRAAKLPSLTFSPLPEGDSAPAVDREVSDRAPPPSHHAPPSASAESAPVIEIGPGSELPESGSAQRMDAPLPTPRWDPGSLAAARSSSRHGGKRWLLVAAMFIIVGVVISRWAVIQQLVSR